MLLHLVWAVGQCGFAKAIVTHIEVAPRAADAPPEVVMDIAVVGIADVKHQTRAHHGLPR